MNIKMLFGKYAGVVSGVLLTAVALIKLLKPELLDTETAVMLMTLFGLHANASDSPVNAVKG